MRISHRVSLARRLSSILTLARGSRSAGAVLVGALLVLGGAGVSVVAQIPGRNVNMVAGTTLPDGDPYLQRQNEPSIAASTRNPLHLVAGSNDYRTVDLPGLPNGEETGDAWVSVYKSFDGGQRWSSTLIPGYPQEAADSPGRASPLYGYQAAADPVVRAGTSGLIYYNGLVFDRVADGKSGIFLARFVDRNNKENGDPILYLGTSMVVQSTGAAFLDKPWMAVDIPRGNSGWCAAGELTPGLAQAARVKRNGHRNRGRGNGGGNNPPPDDGMQYVPAGAVYVVYSSITGDATAVPSTQRSEIFLKRSNDCGVTWSPAIRVSSPTDALNQGATLAINPANGHVYVAWRRFSTPAQPDGDAIMVARLPAGTGAFDPPGRARGLRRSGPPSENVDRVFEHRKKRANPTTAAGISEFQQGTTATSFRTNAYPTMAFDGAGRAYIAWSERGFAAAQPNPDTGDARIMITTTTDARTFTTPAVVDDQPPASQLELFGHQLMPSLAFAGGKLMLVYYDLRETRAQVFGRFVDDSLPSFENKRQTFDIRAVLGTPGATPVFAASTRVSDYLQGARNSNSPLEQMQFNPPNLPMFKLGTVPFVGDYIDLAPAPPFVPLSGGGWAYNTAPSAEFPVFHAAWTDNRDVRPPLDGNWANYSPPNRLRGPSLFDPSQTVEACVPGNAGSRNQNIYTARIGGGLLVGAPGNSKPLSQAIQRGFVVFAQNQTAQTRTFRMTVLAQPVGGVASFKQFLQPLEPPQRVLDVRVPPRSTASRTVYVTSSDPRAQVIVNVSEVTEVGGAVVTNGLTGRVILNPDIENPDIENPDIENPDIENELIENADVYNPDIENPDIENPDIENPDIENPDIENPDIENVVVANPDIENIGVGNPDIENPDIENPDIENPDIENSTLVEVKARGVVSDITWTVSNIGNTTSAFNVNMFLSSATLPGGLYSQLIIYKTYKTPVAQFCALKTETRNVLITNVPSPVFISPGQGLPIQNDPSDKNATLWLAPGELGKITLRVYDTDRSNNITVIGPDGLPKSVDPAFNPATQVTPGVAGQGVDVLDPGGTTRPPVITTTGTNVVFLQQPTTSTPGNVIAPPVSVRLYDNAGAPLRNAPVSISLLSPTLQPVGATLGGGLGVSSDPSSGIATFSGLTVDQAGSYVLRVQASAQGVEAMGHSVVFAVGPRVVSFVQQPVGPVNVGAPMAPVSVRVTDAAGASLPNVQVALTLLTSASTPVPGGVTLSGATSALTNADGTASFANLSVNQAGAYVLRATATAPGAVGVITSASFNVAASATAWTASGNGVVTLLNNGATGTPSFSYSNPAYTGSWTLTTTAAASETVNLTYSWIGQHQQFQVTTGLDVFVNRGGTDVYVLTLVNEGPYVCCVPPSNGFGYVGATTITVQAGDIYGFRVRGSNFNSGALLTGTVSVVVGGTPQFTVNVIGSAGGALPDTSDVPQPTRVYGGTLAAGQQVTIAALGLVQRGPAFGPNGPGGTAGLCDGSCLLAGAPIGSLLARVGAGPWQLVGAGPTTLTAASAGLLEFAVNDNVFTDNTGAFWATVVWGPTAPPTLSFSNLAQIFDGTPRAVTVTTVSPGPVGLPTAVTYNGSPTAPSAIGAYTVEAIAAGAGYLGRGSVNETIASTVSAGGRGGGPYPAAGALSCAPGVFASGIRASNTGLYGLGSGQLICSSGGDPARFVGTLDLAPSYTDVTCGPGEVMVGLHGLAGPAFGDPNFVVMANMGPRCQPSAGGGITDVTAVGGGTWAFAASPFSLSCPSGQAVTGVVGGVGEVVDSVALVCKPVSAAFTETVITGDASILNDGVLIAANDLGDSPSAVTVNGVLFGTDQGGLTGSWQLQDPGDFSTDPFSPNLDAVLSDLQFSNTLVPVNFTVGGLTPGVSYRLQLLFSNDLNPTGDRVNVTVQGATWVLDDWQPNPINLTVQFTATSPSAVVTFAPGAGSGVDTGRAVLNGYVIHQMTP